MGGPVIPSMVRERRSCRGGLAPDRSSVAGLPAPRLGRPEQVPLPEFDAELDFRAARSARRSIPSASRCAPIRRPNDDERLDQRLLRVVVTDAMDDLTIDLDDRGPERRDEREAGIAGTRIVHCEPEPELAQRPNLALERPDVRDRLLFSAFDRDLVRVQPRIAHLGAEGGCLECGIAAG